MELSEGLQDFKTPSVADYRMADADGFGLSIKTIPRSGAHVSCGCANQLLYRSRGIFRLVQHTILLAEAKICEDRAKTLSTECATLR
jgi:hypothetical protein